ncbi:hypothetical protein SRHO_G00170090 [Serrasalmus rhombeus]
MGVRACFSTVAGYTIRRRDVQEECGHVVCWHSQQAAARAPSDFYTALRPALGQDMIGAGENYVNKNADSFAGAVREEKRKRIRRQLVRDSRPLEFFSPRIVLSAFGWGSELSLWHTETWAGSALTVDLEELIMVLISHTAAICHMLFLGPVTYYELWVKNGVSPQDKMPHLCNK